MVKSHMTHAFSMIPKAEIPRSNFNRTHTHKTTIDSGYLYPILVDEYLPGDTFNCKMTVFGRLSTPVVPFMDNLKATIFFFAVPNRLIWNNWQKMNGEQVDPGDSTDYLVPQIIAPDTSSATYQGSTVEIGGVPTGHLFDYMGVQTHKPNISFSALWGRAYNLIYNEWFRDENLINSLTVHRDDGPDSFSDYNLVRRGKRHDYITSALPWPQKGPGIELPLGISAPVITQQGVNNKSDAWLYWNHAGTTTSVYGDGGNNGARLIGLSPTDGATKAANGYGFANDITDGFALTPRNLVADLSKATAATINSLRQAFQIQKLYEKDARGGTRYTEIIRAHFGVVSPDARLQRPEFLGSSEATVNISSIPQTSATATGSATPQGNLAAMGTVSMTAGFTKSFTEHGVIIGLVHIGADLTYQNGMNRMWFRRSRFDFYWPTLAHLGEQAILYREIWTQGRTLSSGVYTNIGTTVDGVTYTDESVFGYQERYAEYRYKPSLITGKLNSNAINNTTGAPETLDVWHLAQNFTTIPLLNQDFIEDKPPVERVLAVQNEPQFIIDSYIQMMCARPMPVYSVPGLVDHF